MQLSLIVDYWRIDITNKFHDRVHISPHLFTIDQKDVYYTHARWFPYLLPIDIASKCNRLAMSRHNQPTFYSEGEGRKRPEATM